MSSTEVRLSFCSADRLEYRFCSPSWRGARSPVALAELLAAVEALDRLLEADALERGPQLGVGVGARAERVCRVEVRAQRARENGRLLRDDGERAAQRAQRVRGRRSERRGWRADAGWVLWGVVARKHVLAHRGREKLRRAQIKS
jgi:hypothetical protein